MRVRIASTALVLGAALLAVMPDVSSAQAAANSPASPNRARREYVLFFNQDSADLMAQTGKIIDAAVKGIEARRKANTLGTVKVVGYADTADTNDEPDRSLKLSEERANAVRDALVAKGVPADLVKTEGRGKRELAVKTKEHVSNIRNRRVRIVMYAPGE